MGWFDLHDRTAYILVCLDPPPGSLVGWPVSCKIKRGTLRTCHRDKTDKFVANHEKL